MGTDHQPEVEFICRPEHRGTIPEPQPASNVLPEWYKQLDPILESGPFTDRSVRACPAFLDALSLGWILPFEADIRVHTTGTDEGTPEYDDDGAGIVSPATVGDGTLPDDAVDSLRFHSNWAVSLPDEYSLLVTQPMNRRERRYRVVAQIITTDRSLTSVTVPAFWLADGGRTIIRAGDPLVQVIPLKRGSRLETALARPFRTDGERSYTQVRRKSKVNRSWYRKKDWTPKSTRVVSQ